MLFCPLCANMLLLESASDGRVNNQSQFYCSTCAYVFRINNKVTTKVPLLRKQVDSDVFGGDEAWLQAEQCEAECGKCHHKRANFMEIQVDTIDEPKTSYFKCIKCSFLWSKKKDTL
ncbi:hypothetical protein CYY_004670 [Polysphondylium violaceum]|uniref:DNA-directed RNA polymerase subunit n=1 Tax=Polysphondylium violaceum TaxID=133409 RepID=A0A8J4PXQ0_9MYCE|nr:hypothetical protein CYY_004670 [Polysphondylium violaceum]